MVVVEHSDVETLSREDGIKLFDELAHELLGMSGEDFVRAWDSGKFADDPERAEVMRLVMLLPLVR